MRKIVLYGAGELGRKNLHFLKKHDLENYIEGFCDRNWENINNIDGIPCKSFEAYDKSVTFVISLCHGCDEVEELLKKEKRTYYWNLGAWIFDSFIGKERDDIYLNYVNADKHWMHPDAIKIEGAARARKALRDIKLTKNFYSQETMRIGSEYGGWVIPKQYDGKGKYILCAGAGEDISFDCEMAEKFECNVVIADPTPRAIKHFINLKKAVKEGREYFIGNTDVSYKINAEGINRIKYEEVGLAGASGIYKFFYPQNMKHVSCSIINLQDTEEYFEAECYTFKDLLQKLGIPEFDLVKIDIEGMEYEVVKSIIDSRLLPEVLCIDFDETNIALDINADKRIMTCISLLKQNGMRPIWIEGDSATFVRV